MDGTLSSASTLGQSEPGSNGNEGVINIPQIFRTGVSPAVSFVLYSGHLIWFPFFNRNKRPEMEFCEKS